MAKQITQKFCALLYICISLHAPLYGAEGAPIESKHHHNTHTTKRKKKKRSRTWAKIAGVSAATAVTASLLYMLARNGSSKKAMLPEIPIQDISSTTQPADEMLPVETSAYDRCVLSNLFFSVTETLCDNKHWSSVIKFMKTSSLSAEQQLLMHVLHQDHATSKRLIEEKADVNYSHNNWTTPLHIATCKSDEKMVTLLVEAKADVNKACGLLFNELSKTVTSSSNDTTPLYHAFRPTYNKSILQCLVKAKAEINQPMDHVQEDALSLAIWDQRSDAVKYLLEHKAEIHKKYRGNDQFSIIHMCAITPNVDIMELLITAGATSDQPSVGLLTWKSNQPEQYTDSQNKEIKACLELLSAIPQA